ncbi:SMP-30/gluconolactonase/LRE family protein [Streptomyces davaonensis]|uniref:SMP-30/gluconolactonase/LRE family protein n=1 Tax=Streptomyces davaonensis TaxID=348043 RepID=UPI001E468CB3|nr:YncE family protein [Streptomyces davaonensis]
MKPISVAVDVHDNVFVTNSGANTVSVIKSVTNTVSATLNVGFNPESVATDPQFGVYVANGGTHTVSAFDRFHALVATIDLGGGAPLSPDRLRLAVDHLMGRAYVANRSLGRVSIIKISSNPPLLFPDFFEVKDPLGVAVDPVSHRVFVTRPDHNKVSVIDATTTPPGVKNIPVGERPTGIAIDPQKRRVYVANSGFKTVSVIDMTTDGVTTIDVGASPTGLAVDAHGGVYVTHPDGLVRVIDPGSASVIDRIPVGSRPQGLAFEPHSNRVYVANLGNGTVSAIDLAGG